MFRIDPRFTIVMMVYIIKRRQDLSINLINNCYKIIKNFENSFNLDIIMFIILDILILYLSHKNVANIEM